MVDPCKNYIFDYRVHSLEGNSFDSFCQNLNDGKKVQEALEQSMKALDVVSRMLLNLKF